MRLSLTLAFFLAFFSTLLAQRKGEPSQKLDAALEARRVMLPNGWSLTPAGRSVTLGDLPLNIAVAPSGKLLAVTNNGQSTQTIQLIDAVGEKMLHSVEIPKSFYGLKFSGDGKFLYASGGNDNVIWQYAVANNRLALRDSLVLGKAWPEKISPVGLEIGDRRNLLYVVTKENNSLYVLDLKTKSILHHEELGHEGYACVLSPDGKMLYISYWGGKQIGVFDTNTRKITGTIDVGTNPNELILNKKGSILFVANAGDNSVSVIDTRQKRVVEVLNAALYPDSPSGTVTNGLALSA